MFDVDNDWGDILANEVGKEYFKKLTGFVMDEYKHNEVFPKKNEIFNALKTTSYQQTKVVIIGQDPYHEKGQAHGLCFSVNDGVKLPPSLRNIFKEIESDLGVKLPKSGDLTRWARQGVLLLNAVLTVKQGEANSHKNRGWEKFTDNIIASLNNKKDPIVFILWGAKARDKSKLLTNKNHKILESAHPSPLSAYNGFFGCKHFSKANEFLKNLGQEVINW
jgi:uracil-DNA glycosylase